MRFSPEPLTDDELLALYRDGSASSLHMLVWHSLIVGTCAKTIVDLGLGNSTRVALTAAQHTGGVVYSCDADDRFRHLADAQTDRWRFFCEPSASFLPQVPTPIDVAFHDASHESDVVLADLLVLFPKMRQFGVIAVHDTQHPRYTLLETAMQAVTMTPLAITATTLPYGCGLTLLRVEDGGQPPIDPALIIKNGRVLTVPRRQNTITTGVRADEDADMYDVS